MINGISIPAAFTFYDAYTSYVPGDTARIIRRLTPKFADISNGSVVDSFNPFFGGGNSLTYAQICVGNDFTVVDEAASGASIEVHPPAIYPGGQAGRAVPRMGKVSIPATSAGEKFAFQTILPASGYNWKWNCAICPPFIQTLSIFQGTEGIVDDVESSEQTFTFTGTVKRPYYSATYPAAGTDYHLWYPDARPVKMEIDNGMTGGETLLSFALDAAPFVDEAPLTSWSPESSDTIPALGVATLYRFAVPLPPVAGPDEARQLRIRVIDDNGLCSPWYHPKVAPRANLIATEQGDGFLLDASKSYSVDGTHTFTWYAGDSEGHYVDISDLVAVTAFGIATVKASDLPDYEPLTFKVRVTNTNELYAERAFTLATLDSIGVLHLPTGSFLSAQTLHTVPASVVVQRRDGTAVTTVSTTTSAQKPTLFAPQIGNLPTAQIALLGQDTSSRQWRLWLSSNGARTLSPLATVFSSPAIDFAHAALFPGGAVAVAILKGASNTLVFKRTGDLANWPPDSQAVIVRISVANAPVYVLVSAQKGNELYITDAKTFWLTSKDGGRTWV